MVNSEYEQRGQVFSTEDFRPNRSATQLMHSFECAIGGLVLGSVVLLQAFSAKDSLAGYQPGRGLQGRGRGFDMGSIKVPDRTSQRQKEPSVTRVFCKLRPSFSLSRHPMGSFRNRGALEGWVGRAEVLFEMRGRSSAG